jgi:hypothetical protein
MVNECMTCSDRHMGCHSNCEAYKRYCAEVAKIRSERRKERVIDGYCISTVCARKNESARKRRKYSAYPSLKR